MPRLKNRVTYYDGNVPLFHKYGIEKEISKIQSRRVELPSGGSIVIDQTEAIVAIDVNSGRARMHRNAEQTAYKINLEAAAGDRAATAFAGYGRADHLRFYRYAGRKASPRSGKDIPQRTENGSCPFAGIENKQVWHY